MHYRVKGWGEFQHYKDRSPTWVKLHKSLLDDYEFHCLPVASKALAPMLWLLASEYKDPNAGIIPGDNKKIAFRLRMSVKEVDEAIKPLIENGFIEVVQDASELLAEPEHNASLETETYREETETQEETEKRGRARATPPQEITQAVEAWNGLAELTGLTAVRAMTSKRRTALQARLRSGGLAGWQQMLAKIRGSPFLTGNNDRGWKADFDWLLAESNFVKVMEGKYDGKPAKPETTWASAGDALAAKYRAAAELEAAGQIPIVAGIEPSLRLATPIRQDAGRA